MKSYLVMWEIDVDADTPLDAAKEAFAIMQQKGTTATFFIVQCGKEITTVDLEQESDKPT